MISVCIFSKNRAMQLDACLRSIAKNAPYITDLSVIYTHDEVRFRDAYNELIREYPSVDFIYENESFTVDRTKWRDLIISLVSDFKDYFLWGTDDSLFYRRVDLTQEKMRWAFTEHKAISLNLRVGLNVIWQNHWHSEKCPNIPFDHCFEDLITWDSSNISVQNDIGRLWQNDASIMPKDAYLSKLKTEDHWYKGRGCRGLDNLAQSGNAFNPRRGACFDRSVYVNVPVNLVHVLDNGRLYADNWGRFVQQDIFTLNEKFLDGYRIDWEAIDFSDLDCGRKEVQYEFNRS